MGDLTDALRRARREAPGVSVPPPEARDPQRGPPSAQVAEARPPNEDERRSSLGAEISRSAVGDWASRAVLVSSAPGVAESFRRFALRVRAVMMERSGHTLMVTSAMRLEGKTTTATNLALALASMAANRRIALLDLDLRRPSIGPRLDIVPTVGIEQVLAGEASPSEARIPTEFASLDVFAVARHCSDAHEILSGDSLKATLEELGRGYDMVVIDTPPVLLVPDAQLIAPHADGCLVVVRGGNTLRSAFRDMLDLLPSEKLIGCFLNDTRFSRHARSYYDYYETAEEPASEAT